MLTCQALAVCADCGDQRISVIFMMILQYVQQEAMYMYMCDFCSAQLQSHTTSDHLSDTEPATNSEYDSSKPPAYDDALTYCKTEPDDDGYPEPSLVNEPPPSSYDSIH